MKKWLRSLPLLTLLAVLLGGVEPVQAVAPIGACCQPGGACVDTLDFECSGSFIGVGTTCADVVCPASIAPSLSGAFLLLALAVLAWIGRFGVRRLHRAAP